MQHLLFHLPKMSSKTVWVGCYFDHYNGIIIFSKQPIKHHDLDHEGNLYYDMDDNKNCIAATIGVDEFKELFPKVNIDVLIGKNGNVISIEPTVLIKMTIMAVWENNKLRSFNFSCTGY